MRLSILFYFTGFLFINAQVGIGTTTPDPSSILDVSSTEGGFLMPRMNLTQRNNISTPATGLMIYLIDGSDQCLQIYNGTSWENIYCPTTNTVPKATNVSFTGDLTEFQVLNAVYTYQDDEFDLEDFSQFQWYIADDVSGTNTIPISGANTLNFTLTSNELSKYISFGVTPIAETGALTGIEVLSPWQGIVKSTSAARINEFHYDNVGADENEFIEIRITGNSGNQPIDLTQYTVTLYNGSNALEYASQTLDNLTQSCDANNCYYTWNVNIQNGSPDGIALADSNGLIEFISYEGSLTAADGIANGTISTDIGVQETSATTINGSIERTLGGGWNQDDNNNSKGLVNSL